MSLQQTGRLRTYVHTLLLQLLSLPACSSSSSSCSCLPACTRVTAQISCCPTACRPIARCACIASAAVQMWATCNPGTAALVSRVPYEPAASHSLLPPRSPSGAASSVDGAAVRRPRLSVSLSLCLPVRRDIPKMKGHSPERAALTFVSGKERTLWHVHPSVNPSFYVSASRLWRPLDCLSPPHAPNLVFDCFFIPPPHRSRHRPSAMRANATHAWLFGWAAHRFIACAAAPPL